MSRTFGWKPFDESKHSLITTARCKTEYKEQKLPRFASFRAMLSRAEALPVVFAAQLAVPFASQQPLPAARLGPPASAHPVAGLQRPCCGSRSADPTSLRQTLQ